MKAILAVLLCVAISVNAQYGYSGEKKIMRPAVKPQFKAPMPMKTQTIQQVKPKLSSYEKVEKKIELPKEDMIVEELPIEEPIQKTTFSSYNQPSYGQKTPSKPTLKFGARQSAPESSICVGLEAGTKIANPSNQQQFFACLEDGESILMECPGLTKFNVESNQCEATSRQLPGCSSNPCQNNGLCVELENKQYKCECQVGFAGRFCETTDACSTKPCGPSGLCRPLAPGGIFTHECLCKGGKEVGIDCTNTESNPCLTSKMGFIAQPSGLSPQAFYLCDGDLAHLSSCPGTLTYNHDLQRCEQIQELPRREIPRLSAEYGY